MPKKPKPPVEGIDVAKSDEKKSADEPKPKKVVVDDDRGYGYGY